MNLNSLLLLLLALHVIHIIIVIVPSRFSVSRPKPSEQNRGEARRRWLLYRAHLLRSLFPPARSSANAFPPPSFPPSPYVWSIWSLSRFSRTSKLHLCSDAPRSTHVNISILIAFLLIRGFWAVDFGLSRLDFRWECTMFHSKRNEPDFARSHCLLFDTRPTVFISCCAC